MKLACFSRRSHVGCLFLTVALWLVAGATTPAVAQVIQFAGQDRVHAKWDLSDPYGHDVRLYWVVGATWNLIAAGPHLVGQERRAGLQPGVNYGYLAESDTGGPPAWYPVTVPSALSGTLLYDEEYVSVPGITGSVSVPADHTLQFRDCDNLALSPAVSGTLIVNDSTNVAISAIVGGAGALSLADCSGLGLSLTGSGGSVDAIRCRLNDDAALLWSGASSVFLDCIFDGGVRVAGTGYTFDGNTFYGRVRVGAADPIFDGNVFLGMLDIVSTSAVPRVENNSFLGLVGIEYNAYSAPATPIAIGPNYYGDPSGPRGYPEGSAFLGRDGAQVQTQPFGTPCLTLAPAKPTGSFRTDNKIFPAVWCAGQAHGGNTAGHQGLDPEIMAGSRAGLPGLISLDVRGWDQGIRGVRVYAEVNGVSYEATQPVVYRDPYSASGGRGNIKHGGSTFNIIVPPLTAGTYPCKLFLDTRGITGYTDPGGTNAQISSGFYYSTPAYARPLHLMVVGWEIWCPGYPQTVPQTGTTEAYLEQHLSAMLPLRRDEYHITVHPAGRYVAGYTGLYEIFSTTLLFNQLRYQLTEFLDTYNASTTDPVDRLIVVVPHGTLGSANGMAGSGVNSGWDRRICVLEDSASDAAIHELGHSFGLWTGLSGEQYGTLNYPPDGQVISGISAFSPDAGLSIDSGRIRHFPAMLAETGWHDVMGRTEPSWPNFDTLTGFGAGLATTLGWAGASLGIAAAPQRLADLPAGQRRALVRALVDSRYRIFPGTVRAADVTAANFAWIAPIDSAADRWYEFSAFDGAGVTLTNYHFVLEGLSTISTNPALGGTPWQATFDYPSSAVRCEIRGGQYDWTLYWEARSADPLACALVTPAAGTTLSNSVNVSWQGTSSNCLLYRFVWSTNNGANWLASADVTEATNATLPVEFLTPSDHISFKVIASDGMKTAEARVDNLQRAPMPPVVSIVSPQDGDRNDLSNTWTFAAQATDPQAGVLANIQWVSSRDGILGSGILLTNITLSAGIHTISAVASQAGLSSTTQVQVTAMTLTNIDLAARSNAFTVLPPMFDPTATMTDFMAPGVSNRASFRMRNEGVPNSTRATLALYIQPPGGAETLAASTTVVLAAFEEGLLQVDYVPTTSGVFHFRAAITDVEPSDTNTANNEHSWPVPCGLGHLLVAFDPPDVATGAHWAVDGGPWHVTGATVSNLTAGTHTLSFQAPPGYLTPADRGAEILSGRLTVYRRRLERDQGYLRVTLSPPDAVNEGALWRVDDSPDWQASGVTLSNLTIGTHTVVYRTIPWWVMPPTQTVSIAKATLTETNGVYTYLPHPPSRVTPFLPDNGATNQPRTTTQLLWFGGGGDGTRVYFGTNAAPQPSDWRTNEPYYIYAYDPGTLDYNTTYYWRIDTTNVIGVTTGVVWHFTTKPMGPEFTSPLTVEAEDGMLFHYRLAAIRATGMGVANVPPWMAWTAPDTLSGFPDGPGYASVDLWATNATQREEAMLSVSIQGGTTALSWRPASSGTALDLLDVTYGAGQFVAVGEVGTVLTSSNGTTWVSRPTGRFETLHSVTWGDGRFVAAGSGGLILTSTNGSAWSATTSGSTEYNSVCWGSNLYAVVGYSRTIRTSTNAATWTNRGSGGPEPLGGVTWGTHGFVAVGGLFSDGPSIFQSTDGIAWDSRDSGTWQYGFYDVAWGNQTYVAVGYNGKIMTSPDGAAWTLRYGAGTTILRGVTFAENQFLAVGNAGTILSSHRGGEWTYVPSGTNVILHAVAGGPQSFVAVGKQGAILTSPYEPDRDRDGAPDWQERVAGTDPTNAASLLRLIQLVPSAAGTSGVSLAWQTVTGRVYAIDRSTNLLTVPPFQTVFSNIAGQAGTTLRADTNTAGGKAYYYRISVQP